MDKEKYKRLLRLQNDNITYWRPRNKRGWKPCEGERKKKPRGRRPGASVQGRGKRKMPCLRVLTLNTKPCTQHQRSGLSAQVNTKGDRQLPHDDVVEDVYAESSRDVVLHARLRLSRRNSTTTSGTSWCHHRKKTRKSITFRHEREP